MTSRRRAAGGNCAAVLAMLQASRAPSSHRGATECSGGRGSASRRQPRRTSRHRAQGTLTYIIGAKRQGMRFGCHPIKQQHGHDI